MAKELRKSRGEELFAVAVREVFDAVAELRTDQSTEWTEELKESLMEFADIIAEPTDLPPEREFDFEINLESDEPPKERTYRMSPAELQETMMNRVLSPYLGKFCVVYLDDVLIYSKTAEEHLEHIRLVLRELQRHHLHIKLSKCSFGGTSVEFLGHIVEAGQIKMDPRKVEAVQQWPVPKTVKDVRGFLGLAGYYRKFIHNFAAIAAPLHDLTKNQPEFVWTPRADAAFRALKDAMACRKDNTKDDFNHYLSKSRINVECAFGILVRRFGVLRIPMGYSLKNIAAITEACMKLHNICIDNLVEETKPLEEDCTHKDHCGRARRQDKHAFPAPEGNKKRQNEAKRVALWHSIVARGLKRPKVKAGDLKRKRKQPA
eukprot:jgi/Tetstr1/424178/TSEL_014784.t1